jgi:hypothetical protein
VLAVDFRLLLGPEAARLIDPIVRDGPQGAQERTDGNKEIELLRDLEPEGRSGGH